MTQTLNTAADKAPRAMGVPSGDMASSRAPAKDIEHLFEPLDIDPASELEIHLLTSKTDVTLALWALTSWYRIHDVRQCLIVHDDGTLDEADRERFHALFPGCTVVSRKEADAQAAAKLASYPALVAAREQNPLMIKVLDFAFFARSERYIMLDSDVFTFFPVPELRTWRRSPKNLFLRDNLHAFCIDRETFLRFASPAAYKQVNSGFGLVNASMLDLGRAEFVVRNTRDIARPYWAGQTLSAILSEPFGIRLLNDGCQVARGPGLHGVIMKHYAGSHRKLAYSEGIPHLKRLLLDERNQALRRVFDC